MDNSDSDIQKGVKIASQVIVPYLFLRLLWVFLFPVYIPELSPAARKIERQLQEQPPEIVFLGNSTVQRAIDLTIFSKHLDVPVSSVQKVWLGDAPLATLYVILKERFLKNGHQPKLIIIGSSPFWLVSNQVPEGGALIDFQAQLSLIKEDPVILERLDKSVPSPSLLGVQKEALRKSFLEGSRNFVGKYFFDLTPRKVVKQLDEVFAFERRRKTTAKRSIPITEGSKKIDTKLGNKNVSLQTSFALPIIDVVREMGSKIIFVELPMEKGSTEQKMHLISKELHRDLSKKIVDSGAGHLHYTYKSLPSQAFADSVHLNTRGRIAMSEMLAQELRDMDVLNEDWKPKNTPLELSTFYEITSSQKSLSKDVILQTGEVLQITLTEDWHKSWGDLTVSAVISSTDISNISASLVLECGTTMQFDLARDVSSDDKVEILAASVKGNNCKKGNTLTLKNLSSKEQIEIHSIRFNHISVLHENAEDVSLLSNSNALVYADRELKKDEKITKIGGEYLTFTIDDFSFLSGKNMLEKHGDYLCSPLLVLENQKVLSEKIETCRSLRSSTSNGFCLGQETILLQKDSGIPDDWMSNTYHLALNPKRSCSNMWWFYAGDRLVVSDESLFQNFEGGTYLKLSAQAFSVGTWRIQLSVSGEVILNQTFTEENAQGKPFQIPLWRPIRNKESDVKLVIEGDGYMTISEIALGF